MAVAYEYDGTLYLAITRRCTLACVFCPKLRGRWTVAGNDMSRDGEPTLKELIYCAESVGLARYQRVAFVGLGEPTLRLDLVIEVGRLLRSKGHHVRLVTDGLASLRAGRDVSAELADALDEVHVSLNAADPETYARFCPSPFGASAHPAVCEFIRAARAHISLVKATVVALPDLDLRACERLASSLGVPLRVRPYFPPQDGNPHDRPER